MEIRFVVACMECGVHWNVEGGQAKCADPAHTHRQYEVHRHRSLVTLPGGLELTAVSFDQSNAYAREVVPDYGLYFDHQWEPPWSHDHVDWPDFGVPDQADLASALRSVLEKIRDGQRVEIGCLGAHGRTGTALACLAVLTGHPRDDAVSWVRTSYCARAVETPEQEAFVAMFDR